MEALTKVDDFALKLAAFEGPLDLLLFLIRKNEIDIYNIPIEQVTKQYMQIIREMETLNLEVAGDFFVMAATLMYIKSRMLLPKVEQKNDLSEEEEDIDPRWELVQQLIEYKKFKSLSATLQDYIEKQSDYLPRIFKENKQDLEERTLKQSDKIQLWNTFNQVLRRLAEKIDHGLIHDENVTVADRMEYILDSLKTRRSFTLSQLFQDKEKYSINEVIATFLAILELGKQRLLDIRQDDLFDEIHCSAPPMNTPAQS